MFLQKTPPTEVNPWEGFLIFRLVIHKSMDYSFRS